jgi:hypothetical protein
MPSFLSLVSQVRSRSRKVVGVPLQLARMVPGCATYLATGRTPPRAYHSMRQLFCLTDGRFNDAVSGALRVVRPPYQMDSSTGILGRMEGSALAAVLGDLDRDGFHVFDVRLPEEDCRQILEFALRTPCLPRQENMTHRDPVLFDQTNTSAAVFDFASDTLLLSEPLRRLIADRSLLSLAQAYLRSRVVMDIVSMWWSTPGIGRASSGAAQLYHFDMDRLKFLKFFFLITDVTHETGPHCYVRGSHHRKPAALLSDSRKSDEEIQHFYGDRVVEIGGVKGTIFAADTRGFHKGLNLIKGTRLLFQLEFANSLFGQNYPRISVPSNLSAELTEVMERYPFTYSNFDRLTPMTAKEPNR